MLHEEVALTVANQKTLRKLIYPPSTTTRVVQSGTLAGAFLEHGSSFSFFNYLFIKKITKSSMEPPNNYK